MLRIILYVIMSVGGMTLFKLGDKGMELGFSGGRLHFAMSVTSLLGILCYGVSFLLWLMILRDNELSYIFPVITGIVIITVTVIGSIVFSESMPMGKLLGILLIAAGIAVVNIFNK